MFSKTPLQKLSLGVAGAIWLALGSVESANAASFKSFSTISINQPLELASIRFGNGNARKNSSDNAIKAALIAGSVVAILIAAGLFDGDKTTLQPPVPPVPTPALLPGLLALGWKMMQKRRSEQSGVL